MIHSCCGHHDEMSMTRTPTAPHSFFPMKRQGFAVRSHALMPILFLMAALSFLLIHQSWFESSYFDDYEDPRCRPVDRLVSTMKPPAFKNPRVKTVSRPVTLLLRNCTVWDGLGNIFEQADLLLENGLIANMTFEGHRIPLQSKYRVIEANGRIVTPGLVDMHSHMGLDSWPSLIGNDDVNEMTAPDHSQLRIIDAFNPQDPAIQLIMTGGVTTSLVLPGSGNVMGGEAHVFKHRALKSTNKMSILHGSDETSSIRWMKMAFGENPKRSYGSVDKLPQTRMGVAWVLRKKLEQAQTLMLKQNQWCQQYGKSRIPLSSVPLYPNDLKLESLVALLRGQVYLNTHVYMIQDIESLLRISHEFNISISALHHATSAHLLAATLAEERRNNQSLNANLIAALFADKGYYKAEAYFASTRAHQILRQHKVPFAIKSDHPVTNAQFLAFEASKLVHFGMNEHETLRAVTSVPATSLGVSDRVGSIRIGMDADIVIWDGMLFSDITARPSVVIIDGVVTFKKQRQDSEASPAKHFDPGLPFDTCSQLNTQLVISKSKARLHFTNIHSASLNSSVNLYDESHRYEAILEADSQIEFSDTTHDHITDKIVKVQNVNLLCIDVAPTCSRRYANKSMIHVRTKAPLHILPAPIAAAAALGLIEINQEPSTSTGSFNIDPFDFVALNGGLSVADGFSASLGRGSIADGGYSKLLENWRRTGGNTAIVFPTGQSVVLGRSAIVRRAAANGRRTGSGSLAVLKENAAVHIQLGSRVRIKNYSLRSFSGQLDYIRSILFRAAEQLVNRMTISHRKNTQDKNMFIDVLLGKMPLALHADNMEQISNFLRIKSDVEQYLQRTIKTEIHRIQLILVSATESWLILDELVQSNVKGVILTEVNCVPTEYEGKRCQSMSSLMHPALQPTTSNLETAAQQFYQRGIPLAVAASDDNFLPDIFNSAAWLRFMSNRLVDGSLIHNSTQMNTHETISSFSWNLINMFQMNETDFSFHVKASVPDFTIFEGDPLSSLKSRILMSVQKIAVRSSGNRISKQLPRSYEIFCHPNLL